MANLMKMVRRWRRSKASRLSATQVISVTFALIILLGAVLLSLPMASANGVSCGFRPALFTATSATCVTGLVLFETGLQWSAFGKTVILCLIEIGGLGFMSVATTVVFLLRRKVGLKQRLVMAQALSISDMDGIIKLEKMVIFGSLAIQLAGALILFLRFLPMYGLRDGVIYSVFHSVSAFCNAGFDIFGHGDSLIGFNRDPVVLLTLAALVVVGGLGFLVWEEVLRVKKFKKFSVYTKLVLVMTGALFLAGILFFLLTEWGNPDTLGPMPWYHKLLNAIFQSVTLRTAGFAAVDQALLTDAGKGISLVLMLIGGSSGSTAGGLKTVTAVVLFLFLCTRARGRETVAVFHRTIPARQVMDAMTIAGIMISLAVFGGVFISATSPISFTDSLFEAVSALATVGVTAGATASLSIPAQWLIMLYMYFGRVGVLTISLGFLMGDRAEERFRYAQTNLLIG